MHVIYVFLCVWVCCSGSEQNFFIYKLTLTENRNSNIEELSEAQYFSSNLRNEHRLRNLKTCVAEGEL